MNIILKHSLRFLFFVLLQTLVLNQIEIGWGIQIMAYPLYILLLPVEMSIFSTLSLAFVMGLFIDGLSNTYGLHTSSLLAFAYFRPLIFKLFEPRDGYDSSKELTVFHMGTNWFIITFGLLLIIQQTWFFLLEVFKLNEILFILQKSILSTVVSFIVCILLQFLFIRNTKKNAI